MDIEAKPGTKRNIGEADLFLPVWQDGKGLLFGNARLRIADHDNHEGNLGLGYRRMLEGGWNLGAYGYFDRRKTSTGNKFNQGTFGAEALGRDFDFRGNVYLPQGDKVRELGTTTVGGVTSAAVVGTTVQVTTSGSTTFMAEERALKGYDLEAGWRLPIWAAEADKQLRVYAGGYHFSDAGVRVSGPRVRAELAMYDLPALWKGAQLMLGAEYQDDSARGGQGFISARIRIPLGSEKNSGRKMNFQERRMAAPVVRDVDVVTQARSVAVSSTPAVVETATQTSGGTTFSVIDGTGFAGTDLTAQLTAAGAGSTVILSGTFNTSAISTLQAGQTLMAGTTMVRTPSGKVVPLTTSATINSTFASGSTGAVAMANNSTVSGLTITTNTPSGASIAVSADGVTGITIANNVLRATDATAPSAAIHVTGLFGGTISGNTLSATGVGLNTAALSMNGLGTWTVTENSFSATNGGAPASRAINLNGAVNLTFTAGSTGNTLLLGACNATGGVSTGSIGLAGGATCP